MNSKILDVGQVVDLVVLALLTLGTQEARATKPPPQAVPRRPTLRNLGVKLLQYRIGVRARSQTQQCICIQDGHATTRRVGMG